MTRTASCYAKLPSIRAVEDYLSNSGVEDTFILKDQIRKIIDEIRNDSSWLKQKKVTENQVLEKIILKLKQSKKPTKALINATGTILHTNLGRSVFSEEIFESVKDLATNYSNLEISLNTGKRSDRLDYLSVLLTSLTGAEEALVVNNNAAAVMLVLSALTTSKEVIVSRGEQIEIGGSFRIPEIISLSGANLKEVGTTNRTRLEDYKSAISEETAAVLKVHTSNYKLIGFTEAVGVAELSKLTLKEGIPLIEDMGSGLLFEFKIPSIQDQPIVSNSIKAGADIVTFSADKLIGGPQAGIIIGSSKYLKKIRKHPLYRALRCDKITIALLEKTLEAYLENKAEELIPTVKMFRISSDEIKERAKFVLDQLPDHRFEIVPCFSTAGGGSLPGTEISSWAISIVSKPWSENKLLDFLRENYSIIARISQGKVLLDFRTIFSSQLKPVINALSLFVKQIENDSMRGEV